MKNINLTTPLILALLAMSFLATASELPSQSQRIWAPTGDQIGLTNHATLTLLINDPHGSRDKGAEDWQIYGKTFGYGILNYHNVAESSHQVTVRGAGGNVEGKGFTGDFGVWSGSPGKYKAGLTYSRHATYYDITSELRNPTFPYPPEPPSIGYDPRMTWSRGKFDLSYRLSSAFALDGGVIDMRRDGTKGSLLRGAGGDLPPQTVLNETSLYEIWVGGVMAAGNFRGDLRFAFRGSDGTRTYTDVHTYEDDRQDWRASLDASYDLTTNHRLMLYGATGALKSKGNEALGTVEYGSPDSENKSTAGRLALLSRFGKFTNLRLAGGVAKQDIDAKIADADGILNAADRQRDRVDFLAALDNTSLRNTRFHLHYKYQQTELEEQTSNGAAVGSADADAARSLDQKKKRQEIALRIRSRLSKTVKLKLGVRSDTRNVDHTASSTDWYGAMGDHERNRLGWEAVLQTRPSRNLPIDLGYRGVDQSLDRLDQKTETTWKANRLFLNVNWIASPRLSIYTMGSYGTEKYELTDSDEPAPGLNSYNYDGTTTRITPGATLQVTRTIWMEAMYEGIFFENKGDESEFLNPVKADHDRAMVRARWQAHPKAAVTFTYRRNEFDENRWDDYIQDLYAFSVSGVF